MRRSIVSVVLVVIIALAGIVGILPIKWAIAATPPTCQTWPADNITDTGMNLNGEVVSTGGENPHVYVGWTQGSSKKPSSTSPRDTGGTDGLEYINYWEHVEDLGHLGTGNFTIPHNHHSQHNPM